MWLKKLRIRKTQSIIMVVISLIVTLLISSAFGIFANLDKPINDLRDECDSPVLKIYQGENSKEIKNEESIKNEDDKLNDLIKKLNEVSDIKRTEVSKCHSVDSKIECNGNELSEFINLTEYDSNIYEKHIRFTNDKISSLNSDECIIPTMVANTNNIKIGDEIEIKDSSTVHKYKVVSTYSDPYSLNSAFKMNIFVSKIPDELKQNNVILVYGNEGIKGQDIIDAYRENNDGKFFEYPATIEECIENSTLGEHITGGILLGIGILILIVSIIMFEFMIKSALINDKKTVAIYKTMGYSYRDILLMNVKFYTFLVLCGSITGGILSNILVNTFLHDTLKNIGALHSYLNIIPAIISVSTVVFFILISILLILRKLKNITPVKVIRGEDEDGRGSLKKSRIDFSFSSFQMALRNIVCDRKNTVFIIIICFLSIYIVNFAIQSLTKVQNMKNDNYYWFGFDKCDVIMDVDSPEDFDSIYDEVKNDENTSNVLKSSYRTVNLIWQKGMSSTSIDVKLYDDFEDASLDVLEGHNPVNDDEIAISYKISKECQKGLGDYIDIYINDNEKKSFLISGIYQTYCELGKQARMRCQSYNKYNKNSAKYDEISVYLNDKSKKDEFINKYKNEFDGKAKVIQREEKFGSVMNKICAPQKKSIVPFVIVTLLLASINIFGLIVLKNAKDRKSYCIYKSIGYSSYDLIKVNIVYILFVSVFSMITAIPIFFMTYSKVMSFCLTGFGIKQYPIDFEPGTFIISNVAVIVLFVVFTILSSVQIYKYKISELNVE